MRLIALFSSALMAFAIDASAAATTPSYDDARKLADSLSSFVAQTGTWDKKPAAVRMSELRRADGLVKEAERLFGTSPLGSLGQCVAAAYSMRYYVGHLNDLARILEGARPVSSAADLYAPMFTAFNFGDQYRACKGQIETLDAPTPKRAK